MNDLGLSLSLERLMGTEDIFYIGAKSVAGARFFLDHGWTTVRDVGGPSNGLKNAIDEGAILGPRIYPSGMIISQTSGHGDFRRYADPHTNSLSQLPTFNRHVSHIADGVPEVLRAIREELRKGSVHIKMAAGGGLASQFDPLHTTQYSLEEMKAAVGAAQNWGIYVMVHAYTDQAVNQAIDAGVKVIEHGQLITEETVKRMAETGTWLSIQAGLAAPVNGEAVKKIFGEVTYKKLVTVRDAFENTVKAVKKYNLKIPFGTDAFGPALHTITNEFAFRQRHWSNVEILQQATSITGELLQLTGLLNPYPQGLLGVIQEGAYADILLIDGNPIDDLLLLTDKDNIPLIMKDGKIYKNAL